MKKITIEYKVEEGDVVNVLNYRRGKGVAQWELGTVRRVVVKMFKNGEGVFTYSVQYHVTLNRPSGRGNLLTVVVGNDGIGLIGDEVPHPATMAG